MKKLLLGLSLLASMSSFAFETVQSNEVYYGYCDDKGVTADAELFSVQSKDVFFNNYTVVGSSFRVDINMAEKSVYGTEHEFERVHTCEAVRDCLLRLSNKDVTVMASCEGAKIKTNFIKN